LVNSKNASLAALTMAAFQTLKSLLPPEKNPALRRAKLSNTRIACDNPHTAKPATAPLMIAALDQPAFNRID